MIKTKLSEKDKFKEDGKWFKDFIDAYVPFQLPYKEDYETMLNSYKVVNNDLSGFKDQLNAFCNPSGLLPAQEHDILAYPELRNKVNILKGEMLSRKDTFHVMLLSSKAIKEKNEQLLQAIKESVDEKTAIDIQAMEMQMQGMSEEEIAQFQQQLRSKNEPEDLVAKDFLSDSEIFYNKSVKYCEYTQDVQDKKSQTFEDVIIADRCFIYSGWRNGKPYLEIRNPLMVGFHKNPNERYVQKGDWCWYTKAITITEAIENYNLTDEQIEELDGGASRGLDHRHDVIRGKAENVFDHTNQELMLSTNSGIHANKAIGLNETPFDSLRGVTDLVYETHFEFKAFKELIFLSYRDEYNKQIVLPLSKEFKIPTTAKKEKFLNRFDQETERLVWFDKDLDTEFTAEKIWIPRKYEIVRLGSQVYPLFREVPYQYTNIEDPFNTFELSTKGAIFNARNTASVSLIQHALQPYFQYLYIKKVQNDELAKYQGAIQSIDIDQIPDQLGLDESNEPLRNKLITYLIYLKKMNKDIYSGSQATLGAAPPSTRSPGSGGYMLGTAMELMNLQQLLEMNKREISMAMGISPQRESNFVSGSNVSDNQQAIQQSYAITEPYFFTHSQIWRAAINDWLINFRKYCQLQFEVHNLKDLSLHYWLPDNTQEVLKVTPNHLTHADIGLLLTNSTINQKYADLMLQNSMAFAQNAGEGIVAVSQIMKDIVMGASPQEIHQRIVIEENKQHERQMQMQQQQSDAQMQQQQAQLQARQAEQEFEKELIILKSEEDRKTKIAVSTISALGFSEDKDADNDGQIDVVEIAKLSLAQQKLELDTVKHKDDVKLKEKKLAIDKKKASQSKKSV